MNSLRTKILLLSVSSTSFFYDQLVIPFGLISLASYVDYGDYEIKGIESGECALYLKAEKQDIRFSDEFLQEMLAGGVTQEEIQQGEEEAKKQIARIEGKDGICKFENNDDLASLLNKWKESIFPESVSCRIIGDDLDGDSWYCISTDHQVAFKCEGEISKQ